VYERLEEILAAHYTGAIAPFGDYASDTNVLGHTKVVRLDGELHTLRLADEHQQLVFAPSTIADRFARLSHVRRSMPYGDRFGLVNHIVEGDLIEAGQAFAREMTGFSLPVLCLARDAIRRAHDLPLHDGLKIEADLSTLAFQTEDAVEGMTAFIEKRRAVFKDG